LRLRVCVRGSGWWAVADNTESMRVVLLIRLTAEQKAKLMRVARRLRLSPSELVSHAVEVVARLL
jgi:hypothetical protein